MDEGKGWGENITDWFKALQKQGIIGLLIGLGLILVLFSGFFLGNQNPPPLGFFSMTIIGACP